MNTIDDLYKSNHWSLVTKLLTVGSVAMFELIPAFCIILFVLWRIKRDGGRTNREQAHGEVGSRCC
jgi:hypothetical protein